MTMCVTQFDVDLIHFHCLIKWALLVLIFCTMLVFNMLSLCIKFHDHWMCFWFNVHFLTCMSNWWSCCVSLPYFVHHMTLLDDFDLVLFRTCSYLIKCDSCWVLASVLTFYLTFDPSLWASGLFSSFGLCVSGFRQLATLVDLISSLEIQVILVD